MAFDPNRYLAAQFTPRTAKVEVPELSIWFDGDEAVWELRSLTANELAKARDAQANRSTISALAEALTVGTKTEKVKELQSALGYSDDVHADIARRIEMLTCSSVEPECSTELAVKLADTHPETFYLLTNTVISLTRQGSEDATKKPATSGKTQKSEPA